MGQEWRQPCSKPGQWGQCRSTCLFPLLLPLQPALGWGSCKGFSRTLPLARESPSSLQRGRRAPRCPSASPQKGPRAEAGRALPQTPTQGWRCAELTQACTHTLPQHSAHGGGVFPLLSRGNILGEVTHAKYFDAVCISRVWQVDLEKQEQSGAAPAGYSDLTPAGG